MFTDIFTIPILQLTKLRLKEMNWGFFFFQGYRICGRKRPRCSAIHCLENFCECL